MTNPVPALAEKRKPAFAMVSMANPFALLRISCGMMEAKELKICVALTHSRGSEVGMGDCTGMMAVCLALALYGRFDGRLDGMNYSQQWIEVQCAVRLSMIVPWSMRCYAMPCE